MKTQNNDSVKDQNGTCDNAVLADGACSDWKLNSITIQFKKGYSFDKSKDRYEGKIKFSNSDEESFEFKIRENLSQPYIDLIAEDIVKNATYLGERLMKSLGLGSV
jgi:hypothetical protein